SLIYRCINLIASSVAEAPVRVYDEAIGDGETLPNHPLRQLITRPNPLMGEASLWHATMVRAAIFGYALLEIERGPYGRPVGLWPLRSEWASPIPRDNDLFDWEYTVPGRAPILIPGTEVCVVNYAPSATGDPRGVGPLEVALREWSLLSTMQDHLKGFFDGGALPVYGLIPDESESLTKDEANLLREQWVEATTYRYGVPPKPPVLQSIKGIERLSFDYNELAYTDLRDVSEIAICQAFGIPGSMVGQRFAQERNTFSNYGEARTSFYQDTVQKHWARLDDALTRSLLPEFETRTTITLEFDTSKIDALQEDQGAMRAHMLDAVRSGVVTRADYRRIAGLSVEPADDVYLMPFNLIETPVGEPMRDTVYLAQPEPDKPATTDQTATEAQRKRERRDRQSDAMQQRALNIYQQLALTFGPELFSFFLRQLERLLGSLPQAAVDAAATITVTTSIAEGVTASIDWGAEADGLTDIFRKMYSAAGQEAAINTAAETGITPAVGTTAPAPGGTTIGGGIGDVDIWDINNPYVKDLEDKIGGRVTGINATTQADIERVVKQALDDGVSIDELASRLEGMYEESYKGRSTTIARTESQVAYNEASVLNYKAMGVTHVELRDNPAHTTDPGSDGLTCSQRHGLVVPIDQVSQHVYAEHPNGSLSCRAVTQYDW
ncbi:MAG: phage portal protein, partial [Hyphomicrobiaceae bacterium]|nr:phage portal protein [Hyphomicrobiaceae bacterium]